MVGEGTIQVNMTHEAHPDSPNHCGARCPLNGGNAQTYNWCPYMDSCATWRDELAFDRLEAEEKTNADPERSMPKRPTSRVRPPASRVEAHAPNATGVGCTIRRVFEAARHVLTRQD
jgi:hypothetical protein